MSTDANAKPSPDDRLRDAFGASSVADVRAALQAGANPDLKVNDVSLLFKAAIDGDLEMVDALIAKGANLNTADIGSLTPVMFLAAFGYQPMQIEVLRRLIAAGADLSVRDSQGRLTALDLSKILPNRPATELLERAHAPTGRPVPPHRDDGWSRR